MGRRGILYVTGALVFVLPPAAWLVSGFGSQPAPQPETADSAVVTEPVQLAADTSETRADLIDVARRDPMALVQMGRERYERHVRSYTCTFVKQERVGGDLTEVQEIEVRFREDPHAIYMLWQKNADGARRALYKDEPKYVDGKGRKLTRVEPNGAIARLFVKDTMLRVDGPEARKSSRRSINEFGFLSTINLLQTYNALAAERGVLDLRYRGTGEIDGRPTFVIVRDLPYNQDPEAYPDARMVLHLDQEWLLPVAVYSYADHNEQQLLGSYVYKDVVFNPDFNDQAFAF